VTPSSMPVAASSRISAMSPVSTKNFIVRPLAVETAIPGGIAIGIDVTAAGPAEGMSQNGCHVIARGALRGYRTHKINTFPAFGLHAAVEILKIGVFGMKRTVAGGRLPAGAHGGVHPDGCGRLGLADGA